MSLAGFWAMVAALGPLPCSMLAWSEAPPETVPPAWSDGRRKGRRRYGYKRFPSRRAQYRWRLVEPESTPARLSLTAAATPATVGP